MVSVPRNMSIQIGKKGRKSFKKGLYAYVGSALGPGGLRARILRHLRKEKKKFWHVDYLLEKSTVDEVIIIESNKKLECFIAGKLAENGLEMIENFGCSDCRCPSHLFRIENKERLLDVLEELGLGFYVLELKKT